MSDTFTFALIAPEKVLAKYPATSATLPASEGDMGVLPQHAPVITTLRPGVVTVTQPTGEIDRLFVAGGFAEVTQTAVTLLADEASKVDELDVTWLQTERDRLTGELREAADEADRQQLQAQLELTHAKLAAAA